MTLEHAKGDVVAEISGAAAGEDLTTGPRRVRRRLGSCAEKRALVDLASAAGSSVTEVAQAFGLAPSQLYGKRCAEAPFPKSPDACMAVSRWSA
ncbi:IS66 family insertion sequence element accessory protein TnpB, partial [Mesorhizobium sp. VK3E]|nr:IS66 family insertion sequence element accessory protein TnpB [Mesorhizobium sp. VK3E]